MTLTGPDARGSMAAPMEPWGPEAERVVAHRTGSMLATGGPGAGKTALLVERYARLVEDGVDPFRIVLFVPDGRAARRGRARLLLRLARSIPGVNVLTPRAFAERVVTRRFADLGYAQPPTPLSGADHEAIVGELLANEDPAAWPRCGSLLRVPGFVRQMAAFVLRAQELVIEPEEAQSLAKDRPHLEEAARFYARYRDVMADAHRLDPAAALQQAAAALQKGLADEDRFDHVMADDYQDAGAAFAAIVDALRPGAESLLVATDPHGQLGVFGATTAPVVETTVVLPPGPRIDPAALLALESPVATPPAHPVSGIEARLYAHPGEEADAIAHELMRFRTEQGLQWGDAAVICRRYGPGVTALRHALARHGIPAVVAGGDDGLAREPAVAPLVDLLRFVFRPERRAAMLDRALSTPAVGMSPHAIRAMRRDARARGIDPLALALSGDCEPARPLVEIVDALEPLAKARPDDVVWRLWTLLPYRDEIVERQVHRDLDALAAFMRAVSSMANRSRDATIAGVLDAIDAGTLPSAGSPEDRYPDAVRILSARHAHGQEFEVALVAGCIEGQFPAVGGPRRIVDADDLLAPRPAAQRERDRLAAERRLFRLAVSRARTRTILFASHSPGAANPRTPSRFVEQRLGITWRRDAEPGPTSLRAIQSRLRAEATDPDSPEPLRLAALAVLRESGDDPSAWWGVRDWTDPGIPLYDDVQLRTSYSRINAMRNCGLQYLYQNEMGLDPSKTFHMWVGTAVHQVIDEAQRDLIGKNEASLLTRLDELWESTIFPNRAIEHRKRLDCEQMLRAWSEEMSGLAFLASEVEFAYELDDAVVRGKIDAILRMNNGHLRIIDYKTGRSTPTREEVKTDLQLASYYLATTRVEHLRELGEAGSLQLVYLGKPSRDHRFTLLSARPADVEGWAEDEMRSLIERVREERYEPSPTADCDWCAFKTICPMWAQGKDSGS